MKHTNISKYVVFGLMGFIFLSVALMSPAQGAVQANSSGLLSMDLLIDDGWIIAGDDTFVTDPDDVFLEPIGDGLFTKITLPTDKIYLPKNLHVDLENTQLYSDPYWAANELGGSRTFLNTSVNAVVNSNATSMTETTALSFSALYGECKATSSATIDGDETLTWKTDLEEDRDADGTTDETGDEEWLTTLNGDEWFVVHMAMASDAAGTSTDNWAEIQLVFQTTAADYTFSIRGYEYAGDTDTTVGSISNGERSDFYSLGSSTTFEHLIYQFNIGDIITDDSESPSIVGLDYIQHKISIDSASASKYITLRNYGITVYREPVGVTDAIDDDANFDYDTSGIMSGGLNDADFLYSVITDEASTTDDTYLNLLPIEHDIDFQKAEDRVLSAPYRKIKFVSATTYEMELEPTSYNEYDIGGYDADKKGYLVRSVGSWDWNWLDYGGNPTSYISWTAASSKLMFEWELEYDRMCYAVEEFDDPALAVFADANGENGWILQGTEQTAELVAAFDGQSDATLITDILLVEPSQTLGGNAASMELKLWMRTPSTVVPQPIGAVSTDGGITGFFFGIVSFITGFLSLKWLRKDK